jgi:hypothetical protein
MERLPDATRSALAPVLGPSEHVSRVAAAVGCTLVLTDRQLHLVRDGVNFRPRTGVQSWGLDRTLSVRMAPGRGRPGRLIVEGSARSVSVFLTAAQAPDIQELLAEIRRQIYTED